LKAGELLLQAKSALSHGEWLPSLREHCSLSERQAQKYMRIFLHKDELELESDSGADLTLAGALASLPAKRDRRCEALALERAARETRPAGMPPPERCYQIHHSACGDLIKMVAPRSIDWIITDPPYPKEFLSCYSDLAAFAAEALKPGGGCLVMTGQSYLPEVIRRLQERLEYGWTLAYHLPSGGAPQIWTQQINTRWKPVLLLSNGKRSLDQWAGDFYAAPPDDDDKRFHDWGQSEGGMAEFIRRFSSAGQTICDPFMGGATTGVAALALGRYFVGGDIDEAHYIQAAERLRNSF
jgi:site-specific DNA-methyltransferase (adenine-specific)